MSKNFSWNPNIGAVNGFGNNPPPAVSTAKIAATTDTTLTVPNIACTGAMRNTVPETGADTALIYAVFGFGDASGMASVNGVTVWVAKGTAATPNLTGSFASTAGMINPSCFLVKGGDVLHFYSEAVANVSVAFYPWSA